MNPDYNLNNSQNDSTSGQQPNPYDFIHQTQIPQTQKPGGGPNKKIVFAGLSIMAMLIIWAVLALVLGDGKKENSGGTQNGSVSVLAKSIDDYQTVCRGGSVTNTAAYSAGGINPMAVFQQDTVDSNDALYNIFPYPLSNGHWDGTPARTPDVQLIGCLDIISSSPTGKVCTLLDLDADTEHKAEQHNTVYKLSIYEAKTGNKLTDKEVKAPASGCPIMPNYRDGLTKIHGQPDGETINQIIKEYVEK